MLSIITTRSDQSLVPPLDVSSLRPSCLSLRLPNSLSDDIAFQKYIKGMKICSDSDLASECSVSVSCDEG